MLGITDKGEVYTWGNPEYGKLAHDFEIKQIQVSKTKYTTRNILEVGILPDKVQGLPENTKIISGSCSNYHTILSASDGSVNSKKKFIFKLYDLRFILLDQTPVEFLAIRQRKRLVQCQRRLIQETTKQLKSLLDMILTLF